MCAYFVPTRFVWKFGGQVVSGRFLACGPIKKKYRRCSRRYSDWAGIYLQHAQSQLHRVARTSSGMHRLEQSISDLGTTISNVRYSAAARIQTCNYSNYRVSADLRAFCS